MLEVGLIAGLFLVLTGLICGLVRMSASGARSEVDANHQRQRASVYEILSKRKKTRDMAEARRNAARRRDESGG